MPETQEWFVEAGYEYPEAFAVVTKGFAQGLGTELLKEVKSLSVSMSPDTHQVFVTMCIGASSQEEAIEIVGQSVGKAINQLGAYWLVQRCTSVMTLDELSALLDERNDAQIIDFPTPSQ